MPNWKNLTKKSREGETDGAMVMFESHSTVILADTDLLIEYRAIRADPVRMATVRLFQGGQWTGEAATAHRLNVVEAVLSICHRPYICERLHGGPHDPTACRVYGLDHRKDRGDQWWDRDLAREDAALEGVVRAAERAPEPGPRTPAERMERQRSRALIMADDLERSDRVLSRTDFRTDKTKERTYGCDSR